MTVSKDAAKVQNKTLTQADIERSYKDPNTEPTEFRRNLDISEDNLSATSSQKDFQRKRNHSNILNKKKKFLSGIEE